MERWRLLLGIQAISGQAAWTGVRIIIGYRAIEAGADPALLGALASTFALPALVAAIPAGRLADRVGGTAMTVTGLAIAATGTIAILMFPGLTALLLMSAVVGLGQLLVMVGQQSFVAQISTAESRDSAFGALSTAMSIGQLVGPPLVTTLASLGTNADRGFPDTGVGLLVCAAAVVPAVLVHFGLRPSDPILRRPGRRKGPVPAAQGRLLSIPGLWRSLTVSAAVLITVDLMYAFVPLWASEKGIGAPEVGLLLAVRAGVSVLSRIGLTWLIDNVGRKALLIASISSGAAALVALPLVGQAGAFAVMVGLGIGLGLPQPLTTTWAINLADASRYGAVLGLRMTASRLGQMSVPIAIGTLASPLGTPGVFWTNAGMLFGAAAVVATSNTDRPPQKGTDGSAGPPE
jgi:MFS family permease